MEGTCGDAAVGAAQLRPVRGGGLEREGESEGGWEGEGVGGKVRRAGREPWWMQVDYRAPLCCSVKDTVLKHYAASFRLLVRLGFAF